MNISFNTLPRPNIPLSASVRTRILDLNTHTPYIPPHPQRGTPYHRYVLLLLPQPPLGNSTYTRNIEARAVPGKPTSIHLDIPKIEDADRLQFDVRGFAQRWGLNGSKGGGVHMWREIWDEDVSQIYADVLSQSLSPPVLCRLLNFCFVFVFVLRGAGAEVRQAPQGGPLCRVQTVQTLCLIGCCTTRFANFAKQNTQTRILNSTNLDLEFLVSTVQVHVLVRICAKLSFSSSISKP